MRERSILTNVAIHKIRRGFNHKLTIKISKAMPLAITGVQGGDEFKGEWEKRYQMQQE